MWTECEGVVYRRVNRPRASDWSCFLRTIFHSLTATIPRENISPPQDQRLRNSFLAVTAREVQGRLPILGRLIHRRTVAE